MRSYLLCSLVIGMVVASSCGDSRPSTDARDGNGDQVRDVASTDRADVRSDVPADATGTGGTGGSMGGTGGTAGTGGTGTAGTGGAAGTTGGNDGGAGTGGGNDGGGVDGAAPTCSDGVKNSDETGIDCGGHCGKCAPGGPCLVNADCQYSCRTDHTCAACSAAADCPGVETECEHRTCISGACGSMREAAGTVLTVQTSGDCKRSQCTADGSVTAVNDDTDVPDDRNPCTNDICTSGMPSHTTMPANSSCGGANHCNAAGQCVGCTVAADCPGTDTACRTRTCTAGGLCGFSFTATGTKLVDPTTGDCKGLQCDGAGNQQVFNDNADLPVDGNACTTDECSSGTPSHRPVASGAACGSSLVCDGANHCVQCLTATTCPGTDAECHTRSCVGGQCGVANTTQGTALAAQTPRDCKKSVCNGSGGTQIVNDDLDLPVDGNPCTQDVCTAGQPSNPFVTAGNSCGASTICDGQGACVTCLTASSCPGTDTDCHHRTCTSGACGIANTAMGVLVPNQTPGDCKRTVCDGNGAPMTISDDLDLPVDGNSCTGDVCAAGVPSNPNLSTGTTCGTDLMCNGQGACVGCVTAANCGPDSTCQTHTCTNGMCGVNNAPVGTLLPNQMTGDCRRVQCDGMGQVQTVNDDNDLPFDGNACTKDLCNAGIKTNPPETAGTACTQSGGSKCNGSGTTPACVQCLAATDCPGTDTECHHRACSASGMCSIVNTADGTAITDPTPGDCKKTVCMTGNPIVVNDDTDVLVDGNACTMDLCTNGNRSNPPLPVDSPCSQGGGTRCNGSASAPACVQCNVVGQCGTSDECKTYACSSGGQCSVTFTANGMAVAAQVTGDCQKKVCNGAGSVVPAIDDTDVHADGNGCTFDLCTNGNPSNPPRPARDACNESNGTLCNGDATTPACVQCLAATDCGTDTFCKAFSCSGTNTCSSTDKSDGTLVPNTNDTAGNCHKDVCMGGATTRIVDDTDLPADGNPCTDDMCSNGTPSHTNVSFGTNCGPSLMCDGNGACVGCVTEADCPLPPNACQNRVCVNNSCGFTNVMTGVVISDDTGNCQKTVCDGSGNLVSQNDDTDTPAPDPNQCLQSVCAAGVPSHPPVGQGVACNQNSGTKCDGAGNCVQCTLDAIATDCPGSDTDCQTRVCNSGLCDISYKNAGTVVGPTMQTMGNCQVTVCDGNGGTMNQEDDTDLPSTNDCRTPTCVNGVPMTPAKAHGTSCADNGRTCDGSGACITSFNVLRLNGTSSAGTAIVLEERTLDGTVIGTPTALPTTASGGNLAIVESGSASSEGSLSLSGDGRYLIVAGYNAPVGTLTVASAAGVDRIVARVDAANPGNVNSTTTISQSVAFTGNNVRSATSQDGTGFWLSGAGSGMVTTPPPPSFDGGVWWVGLGGSSPTQITMPVATQPSNTRWLHIFGGQLYATAASNGFFSVFAVGAGLPTTGGQTANLIPGLPIMTASPFSFVFFDRDPMVSGYDTLYISDDGNVSFQGIEKWTLAQGATNWTRVATFNLSPVVDFKGVAGLVTGNNVTLIGTTDEGTSSRIVVFVDTGTGTPTGSVIATSTTGQIYRGVALSPHL